MRTKCEPKAFLSCTCIRGTKCCDVEHGCNRHRDCDEVEAKWALIHKGAPVPVNFHCDDDGCEECFGY